MQLESRAQVGLEFAIDFPAPGAAVYVILAASFLASSARTPATEGPQAPAFQRVSVTGLTDHHASTGGVNWADIDGDLGVLLQNDTPPRHWLTVRFPTGVTRTLENIPADQVVVAAEH
jgi:hypothetical protein